APAHKIVEASDWRGTGTVLVADDEGDIRIVLSAMLEAIGFSVLVAGNGVEALNVILECGTDLAFAVLDHSMPAMDGHEVLAELERLGIAIPIILSSGYNAKDLRRRFA